MIQNLVLNIALALSFFDVKFFDGPQFLELIFRCSQDMDEQAELFVKLRKKVSIS